MGDSFITRQQAAELLLCSVQTVDRLIQDGTIKSVKQIRRVCVSHDSVMAYLSGLKAERSRS